ncbi:protein NDR1-like [Malania oleifera]|uniref:protein NDR1-like n=1 Tax=Malania oleifera TaxID=397392 RepID=UPI0025AEB3C2|nr:protein NDR1-like [Malania oleifera]
MVFSGISKVPSIYFWVFQGFILLGLASAVAWLSLIPKSPICTITDLHVPALDGHEARNYSTFHRHEIIRNTSLIFNLTVSNPNKGIGINFDDISVILGDSNGTRIWTVSVPGFYQGRKKATSLKLEVPINQQFLRGVTGAGTTGLKIDLHTAVRYRIFGLKSKHYEIDVGGYARIDFHRRIVGEKNVKLHKTLKLRRYGN